jgi:hypothetical protein
MDIHDGLHSCNICNKMYASYKSLWNHNKKFHNTGSHNVVIGSHSGSHSVVISEQNSNNLLSCKYCNILFQNRSNRWRHEKSCKTNKTKIDQLENKIIELQNKITTTNNTNIINNNPQFNQQFNNIIINKVGEESLNKLTYENIKNIFREHKNCLHHTIKYVNFNENIPENHNFYNNSLEGKYVNVFNVDKKEIEKKNKKDFYDTVLLSAINIMTTLYDKIKDSVSKIKQQKLLNMINELKDISFIDNTKQIYLTNINEISYNNKQIVKNTWTNKNNSSTITDYYDDNLSDSDSSKDSFYYLTDSD